jgi:hypothetical protein
MARNDKLKLRRDGVIQRYVRERDKALDDLKNFSSQVNQHVGTAYNILAASLGYEYDKEARKYLTDKRDLITLVLEVVKKVQDLDPSAPKLVEQRDAPVEYEKKEKVILASEAAVEVYKDAHTHGTFEETVAKHGTEQSIEAFTNNETAFEAMHDIATADEDIFRKAAADRELGRT